MFSRRVNRNSRLYVSVLCLLVLSASGWALSRADLDNLISEMKSDDDIRCSKAAIKLGEYGSQAREAIPALIEMVRGEQSYTYASTVLPYLTTEMPVDEILKLTKDENQYVRSLAIGCLKPFDFDKNKTLKIYTALLDHKYPFICLEAADVLCHAGASELCLDTVIQLTHHEDPIIKAMAITAVGKMEIANERIKQVLLDSFSNPDKREVVKAALIYQKLYPDEKKGYEQICTLLKDKDKIIRWHAVRAIGNLKDVDAQTLQFSRELMQDDNKMVAMHACYAMIRHHIDTEKAWEILNKSLMKADSKDDFNEVLAALLVLRELGPAAQGCQEQLIKMVNGKDESVQLIAIGVLGEIQPSKDRVLPVLENKLKMTNDFPIWNITKKTIRKIKENRAS